MFSYTANFVPTNVFVIGAGGTGSRLMPMLSQFMRSITRGQSSMGWIEDPTIWLIDDDTVELKNLLRQNFIHDDVGKYKAAVVAERYQRAYGVNIVPYTERVTSNSLNTFVNFIKDNIAAKANADPRTFDNQMIFNILANSVVIICVDSAQARRDILNTFIQAGNHGNNTFFIDAGNEDSFGQVSFFTPTMLTNGVDYDGNKQSLNIPKMVPIQIPLNYIPMDVNYYANLVDTESTASCADLNQTLAINALMATNIMGVVQNLFYRKPFTFNCLRTSLDGGNSTDYNTIHNYRQKAQDGTYASKSSVKEKNGSITSLNFLDRLVRVRMYDLASELKSTLDKIEAARIAAEQEALRKKLMAERKIAMEAERERARLNFEAQLRRERELAERRAEMTAQAVTQEVSIVPNGDGTSTVAAIGVMPPAPPAPVVLEGGVPPLTMIRGAAPRVRRAVVELALPEVMPVETDSEYSEEDSEADSEAETDEF